MKPTTGTTAYPVITGCAGTKPASVRRGRLEADFLLRFAQRRLAQIDIARLGATARQRDLPRMLGQIPGALGEQQGDLAGVVEQGHEHGGRSQWQPIPDMQPGRRESRVLRPLQASAGRRVAARRRTICSRMARRPVSQDLMPPFASSPASSSRSSSSSLRSVCSFATSRIGRPSL